MPTINSQTKIPEPIYMYVIKVLFILLILKKIVIQTMIYLFFADRTNPYVPRTRKRSVSPTMAAQFITGLNSTTFAYSGVPAYTTARVRSRQ
jgi:hypothetical protein